MKLLIGSQNPGKIKHWKEYLGDVVEIVTLQDLNIADDPEETEDTFEGNALLKAKYFSELTGLPTLADDGGFEIKALNGEPGVHTRRWNGTKMSDQELIDYTLKKMKDIPEGNREAQLRAIVTIYHQGKHQNFEYQIKGIIPFEPHSEIEPGFPFRSVLIIPEINKYHIEMTQEENNERDHRRHLVPAIKKYLQENF